MTQEDEHVFRQEAAFTTDLSLLDITFRFWDEIRPLSPSAELHVLDPYPWMRGGGAWDLEIGRKSRPWWLTDGDAWSYQCNWP